MKENAIKMNLDQLPLLDIFNSLRQRHGLPLGVEEYLVVVRNLEAGSRLFLRFSRKLENGQWY